MRNLVALLILAISSFNSFADEYDRFDGWSATIYGLSHHVTPSKTVPYREINPGLGVRKHFGECFWRTANCFGELSHVSQNSIGGKVTMASVGSKWTLATVDGVRLHIGGTLTYLEYENPHNKAVYSGATPIPFIGIGKGNWDFDISILSRKPIEALTGKDAEAIFFGYFIYRF
ncbi:MAG: hypothetical protein AAB649_03960 [Patescibacteria group bacterium]